MKYKDIIIKTTARLAELGEMQSGTSSTTGNSWARRDIRLVQTLEANDGTTWENNISLSVGTKKMDKLDAIPVGSVVDVEYTISAREYKGRWYNSADLVDIHPITERAEPTKFPSLAPAAPTCPSASAPEFDDNPDNDLPF